MALFANLKAMVRKPYYGLVPLFMATQDLSWIPDQACSAAEALNGSNNTFTFPGPPQYVVFNGATLYSGAGYNVIGTNQIQLIDPNGSVITPVSADYLRAVI